MSRLAVYGGVFFKQGLEAIARSNEFPAFLLWPSYWPGSKVVLEVLGGPGKRVRLEAKPSLLASWNKRPWCLERERKWVVWKQSILDKENLSPGVRRPGF